MSGSRPAIARNRIAESGILPRNTARKPRGSGPGWFASGSRRSSLCSPFTPACARRCRTLFPRSRPRSREAAMGYQFEPSQRLRMLKRAGDTLADRGGVARRRRCAPAGRVGLCRNSCKKDFLCRTQFQFLRSNLPTERCSRSPAALAPLNVFCTLVGLDDYAPGQACEVTDPTAAPATQTDPASFEGSADLTVGHVSGFAGPLVPNLSL